MLDPEQVHDQLLELQADIRLLWRHIRAMSSVITVILLTTSILAGLALRGASCG